jgi:hypothetical protein
VAGGKASGCGVYTHAYLDEQEYTEDGDHDHEDEDGHATMTASWSMQDVFDVRVLTNGDADGGHG